MTTISLFGAHRTGKTTLAKAYADKHGIEFVETSVSAIFRDLGLDPAVPMLFAQRLSVQQEILKRLDAVYERYAGRQAIFDRCPIDLLGYTLGDAVGDSVPSECMPELGSYIDACYDVLNRRFSTVVLVQPGIPLVAAEGKAVSNPAYIEHLNSLMLGLAADPRCKLVPRYIARHVTDLNERVATLETIVGASEHHHQQTSQLYVAGGNLLH
jgi:hypothetical protein